MYTPLGTRTRGLTISTAKIRDFKVPNKYHHSIAVDPDQDGDEFEAEKEAAYKRAVAMFNAVDTSKRTRIEFIFAQE